MNQQANDQITEEPGRGWFNPAEIFENLVYYRWVFLTIFALVFGIGALWTMLKTPIYRADALIQVEGQKGSAVSSALGGSGNGLQT